MPELTGYEPKTYNHIKCGICGWSWDTHDPACAGHRYRPKPLNSVTGSVPHCQRCGWPLGPSTKDGCTANSCSRRPLPPLPSERQITDTERLDWMEGHVFWVENGSRPGEILKLGLWTHPGGDLGKLRVRGLIDALIHQGSPPEEQSL